MQSKGKYSLIRVNTSYFLGVQNQEMTGSEEGRKESFHYQSYWEIGSYYHSRGSYTFTMLHTKGERGSKWAANDSHLLDSTVECFPRFCFVVKTLAYKMALQIFDIFSHDFCLFSTQLTLFWPKNSIGLKKD